MRFLKRKTGLSLLELIIALGLLGAVSVGTGLYMSNAFKDSGNLVNKEKVQSSVTALMNKIGTAIKEANLPVVTVNDEEKTFVINKPGTPLAFKLIENTNTMVVVEGEKTESFEFIKNVKIEMQSTNGNVKGAKVIITGIDDLYELEGIYHTRNTVVVDNNNDVPTEDDNLGKDFCDCASCPNMTGEGEDLCVECSDTFCGKCGGCINCNGNLCGTCGQCTTCVGKLCNECGKCDTCVGELCNICGKCTECNPNPCGFKTFYVAYDLNGGTASNYFTNSSKETYGLTNAKMSHTVSTKTVIVTREGYTFMGWSDNRDTESELYNGGKPITLTKERTVLYAIWGITLTYDTNMEDSGNGSTVAQETKRLYGDETQKEGVQLKELTATREHYTFIGWSKSNDAETATYEAGKTITLTENTTLYAVWEGEPVTVVLDANGGKIESMEEVGVPKDSIPVEEKFGSPYSNIYRNNGSSNGGYYDLYRFGYNFDGWYTEKNGGKKIEGEIKVENPETHILYAHWKINTYTVTFEPNGGTPVNPSSIEVEEGSKYGDLTYYYTLKTGYKNIGWAKYKNGRGMIETNTTVNPRNHKIYAQWEPIEVDVSFQEYTFGSWKNVGDSVKVKYNETYEDSFNEKQQLLTYPDYLIGWYTEKDGKGVRINSTDQMLKTGAHTLYAYYEEDRMYTVTFNSNGGNAINNMKFKEGDYLINLPTPKKERYKFVGWYDQNDINAVSIRIYDNINLTAKYEQIITYTVTFDAGYGWIDEGINKQSITVEKGQKIGSLPMAYVDRKMFNEFDGWYTNGVKITEDTIVNEDLELVAKWETIPTGAYVKYVPKEGKFTWSNGKKFVYSKSTVWRITGGANTITIASNDVARGKNGLFGFDGMLEVDDILNKASSVKLLCEGYENELAIDSKPYEGKAIEGLPYRWYGVNYDYEFNILLINSESSFLGGIRWYYYIVETDDIIETRVDYNISGGHSLVLDSENKLFIGTKKYSTEAGIVPEIYLNPDVQILSGSGTEDDPYIIGF